ncbi:MAG: hypothetical protein ACR2NL_06370 [Acidimicrobiia bacterium]
MGDHLVEGADTVGPDEAEHENDKGDAGPGGDVPDDGIGEGAGQ